MALNPFNQYVNNLQGGGVSLQGSSGSSLQDSQAQQPTVYGNISATAPAVPKSPKQKYINDLSASYGLSNGTVYNKSTGTGYRKPQDFFKDSGVNSFDDLKFDTDYKPGSVPNTIAPVTLPSRPTTLAEMNASIPATPQQDPMQDYKDAYSKYIASLSPSTEVTNAKQKYLDFVQSAESGIAGLEGQGRGIPLGLVRGQQGKLANQAEITAKRLQGEVDIAEGTQEATTSSNKARVDFEQSLYGQSLADEERKSLKSEKILKNTAPALLAQLKALPDQQSKDNYIKQKASELGLSIDQVNSAIQEVMPKNEPIKLGEGDTLFNPVTGQVIYKNPKTYDTSNGSSGGLTPYQQFTATQGLRKELSNNTASARTVQQQYSLMADALRRVETGEAKDLNGTTQAIVSTFNKILDPDSVVREGEYDRTAQGQALISNIEGKLTRIQQGGAGLTVESLREIVNLGKALSDNYAAYVEDQNSIIGQNASQFGLDAGLIIPGGGESPDDIINKYLGFNSVGNTSASIKLGSPLAVANNNPGNLRFVGQSGAVKGKGGFAKFSTPQAGVEALQNQIKLDASRGLTLASFINKYAPPVENNTSQYLTQATKALGVSPSTKLSTIDLKKLTAFMAKKESSSTIG